MSIFLEFTIPIDQIPADCFKGITMRARDEHGTGGYTGSWAEIGRLRSVPREFESLNEATEFVCDHTEKGEAMAVVYTGTDGAKRWFVGGWASF